MKLRLTERDGYYLPPAEVSFGGHRSLPCFARLSALLDRPFGHQEMAIRTVWGVLRQIETSARRCGHHAGRLEKVTFQRTIRHDATYTHVYQIAWPNVNRRLSTSAVFSVLRNTDDKGVGSLNCPKGLPPPLSSTDDRWNRNVTTCVCTYDDRNTNNAASFHFLQSDFRGAHRMGG